MTKYYQKYTFEPIVSGHIVWFFAILKYMYLSGECVVFLKMFVLTRRSLGKVTAWPNTCMCKTAVWNYNSIQMYHASPYHPRNILGKYSAFLFKSQGHEMTKYGQILRFGAIHPIMPELGISGLTVYTIF